MTHKVRAFLEGEIAASEARGNTADPTSDSYSPKLYVQKRLLEFPFEKYPDYSYPAHLVMWPHMRWEHVAQTIFFCEYLSQPKGTGAGKPVRLLGFQVLIITCILGPEDPETGLRIVRTPVMTIGRKNGKSSLVAMLFLAMMSLSVFNLRAQDIQVGAADREQAGILYDLITKLILLDRHFMLAELYHLVPSKKTVTQKKTLSKLHCLSSDAYRAHGANPCAVLLDEFGNVPDPKAREFYGVLSTAFGSQAEPLLMMFSTQAPNDAHIFSEFVDQAKRANLGESGDRSMCGFIFDLPKVDDGTGLTLVEGGEDVDIYAEENWVRPNPALEKLSPGGFRSLADLRTKMREAREMPSLENTVRNLQLNQRITAHSPFISQAQWMKVQVPALDPEVTDYMPCYVGGDLSVTTDLSALAVCWFDPENGVYLARLLPYTPADDLAERARTAKVPYDVWVSEGHLTATSGRTIDYGVIARDMVDLDNRCGLNKCGFDRYKWDRIQAECAALEFLPYEQEEGDFWVRIGQGFVGMSPCIESLETAIKNEQLRIEHNPVATWCASNAVTTMDGAGNRKFEKSKSYGAIDCIVALAMAVHLAMQENVSERAGQGGSVYDTQDLLVL